MQFEVASEQNMQNSESSALSVSAALNLAKGALETITVRIIGEVSELSNKPGYKAVYFTVKDEMSSLPCMMWNNRYKAAGCELAIGQLVEIAGRFSLYAAKGRMNFDVFSVSLAGEGNLRLKVANLAKKLESEGLLSVSRKKRIPSLPQKIGLVTSPRGAAVHDVLRTLRRRFPLAEVVLAGVPVEGANAPSYLIDGLNAVVKGGAEVVLLVRGGGSFEDLMPFNDEALARAIAASAVPIITGIGHEPDTSIADMVADLRASTPTAAAEAVSAAGEALLERLGNFGRRLTVAENTNISTYQNIVGNMFMRPIFQEPMRLFENEARYLDEASYRLSNAIPASFAKRKECLQTMRGKFEILSSRFGANEKSKLADAKTKLSYLGENNNKRFQNRVQVMAARLEDLSPLSVISRGYSMVQNNVGGVVSSIDQVEVGDKLAVTVSDGVIECTAGKTMRIETHLESMEV